MTRWHMGVAAWIAMTLAFIVFWALVVAVIVAVVRPDRSHEIPASPTAPPPGRASEAEHILDERFARGEIDADEYRHRRDLLRSR